MHECRDPVHMGTPQASGHGGPVRACVHRPSARMHGDPACERAWGPGASMRAGPGACVHGNRAAVGARCEQACMARCVRACGGTPRVSGHGDPVRACIETKRAWGPSASVRDGPCERAGVGTWCEQACVGPVHACVGPVRAWIQQAQTRACRDPARTALSSTRVPVSIQHVKK